MGSLPQLSIIKGPTRPFHPNLIHKLFENVAKGSCADNTAFIYEGTNKKNCLH